MRPLLLKGAASRSSSRIAVESSGMPLSAKAKHYLESLWGEQLRHLIADRESKLDGLRRGLIHPADIYVRTGFWNYLEPEVKHLWAIADARAECLLKAYALDSQPFSPAVIEEMLLDVGMNLESAATSLAQRKANEIQVAQGHPSLRDSSVADMSEVVSRVATTRNEIRGKLERQLTIKMYESRSSNSARRPKMKVRDLMRRIEAFRDDLQAHYELWGESLEQPLPDYPVKNVSTLREQVSGLARQLGTLKAYLQALGLPTIMETAYGQWDAYDSAVSNDVAARKGSSIEAVLPQLEQALGRLESLDPESDFESRQERQTRPTAQHVTNIYNLQGAHARVNVQSTDHSLNVSAITEKEVFSGLRQAVSGGVSDDAERRDILERLEALERSAHTQDFLSRYQAFINAVASHMTIILPFIPALTQMLGK